jgi:hypothetical protein
MANLPQRVPLVDPATGLITREWISTLQGAVGATAAPADVSALTARVALLEAAVAALPPPSGDLTPSFQP